MEKRRGIEVIRWASIGIFMGALFFLGQEGLHHGNFNLFMGILLALSFLVAILFWFLREKGKREET